MSDAKHASVVGGPETRPLTRRERRELEEAAAREAAAHQPTPVTPEPQIVSPPPRPDGFPPTGPLPMDLPSSVVPPQPPQPPVEPAQPEPPPAAPVTQPLTRRQLRELEQQQLVDTGVTSPPTNQVEVVADVPPLPPSEPVHQVIPAPVAPVEPAPLPPVFSAPVAPVAPVSAPPVSSPPVTALPVTAQTGSFPVIPDEIPDVDAELAHAREVGSGSPTTHALILPTTPMIDIGGPVGDTGEIIVTGQIPLPRLVTERGVGRQLDDDESFDQILEADSTPLTAPVRATKAVSTRDTQRELQMVRRAPFGSTVALLGVSAILLVAAAAGLIAVAVLSGLLAWPF